MRAFVDQHRDTFGVEPICKALQMAPLGYRLHARLTRMSELQTIRAKRDEALLPQIKPVWDSNWPVYGSDKAWKQINRKVISVDRCTVNRLMRQQGLCGVRRGKVVRTTTPDTVAPCPMDLVNRQFKSERPNQLWVSDFTYVRTWQGWMYVAFVIDVYDASKEGLRC